jgi:predicted O-methyltransferase YrrM
MDLLRKTANKLSIIPSLRNPVLWTEETWRYLFFNFRQNERGIAKYEFQKCQTLENYYEFSCKYIGMHQIKTEILKFLEFLLPLKPQLICEIGTADGGTNFLLSQALPNVELMIGVDLFVRNQFQLQYFSKPSQNLVFLNGSSYALPTVQNALSVLEDRKLDLLFIDGDHNYEGVKKDFLMYRNTVKEGGVIAFHDIIPDYKTRYGKDTLRWAGGVPILWQELRQMYPSFEFVENPEQDSYGIGAIYYSESVRLPPNW